MWEPALMWDLAWPSGARKGQDPARARAAHAHTWDRVSNLADSVDDVVTNVQLRHVDAEVSTGTRVSLASLLNNHPDCFDDRSRVGKLLVGLSGRRPIFGPPRTALLRE